VRAYLLFICLILSTTLLDGRLPGGGFIWDFLNALGFCGLAAIAWLGWDFQAPAARPALRLHSNIALVAALLTGAHALGLLILDPITIEYLKLKAPWYMLAGLTGFLCLLVLAISSFPMPRRRLYGRFSRFRSWHLGLSVTALGLAAWHVLGAAFYLSQWYQQLALSLVAVGLPAFAYRRRRTDRAAATVPRSASVAHADRQSLAGLLLALCLAGAYAGLRNV